MVKIRNIVFDIGQVLFSYNPELIINKLLPKTPFKNEYLTKLFNSDIWQMLDKGAICCEQAVDIIISDPSFIGKKKDVELLLNKFPSQLEVIEESKSLFLTLTESFPVYLLSNFQSEGYDTLIKSHSFLSKAKGAIISGKVNSIKPDPQIYKLLLSTYNLSPEETLFIDDLPVNIEASEKLGINGIVFWSTQHLIKDLKNKYLIEIPVSVV